MDFFQQLSSLMGEGYQLTLSLTKHDGQLTLGVLPKSVKSDSVAGSIPPLILSGLPSEIDEAFFERLSMPLEKTRAVMCNITSYEASLAKAAIEAEKAKNKTTTPAKTVVEAKPAVKPALSMDLFSTPSRTVETTPATEQASVQHPNPVQESTTLS